MSTSKSLRVLTVLALAVGAAVVLSGPSQASETTAGDDSGIWREARARVDARASDIALRGSDHVVVDADLGRLRAALAVAPIEGVAGRRAAVVSIPSPTGEQQRFSVVESSVMAPELAARYPSIRTYAGVGLDDPTARARFALTPKGFTAQVLADDGVWYVDPVSRTSARRHVSYRRDDLVEQHDFTEIGVKLPDGTVVDADDVELGGHEDDDHAARRTVGRSAGSTLTTYRLAVAATGEYTAFHGGTKILGLAAVAEAVNRVTGIYEQEIAARLELVPNNDLLIFTDGATDNLANNDAGTLIDQATPRISGIIGAANYDVGHVFSTGAGGLAYLGVIGVDSLKGGGVTGTSNPTGDAYWVDYVAHELGHQFGADHTFNGTNGSCGGNRASNAAMEPGSGVTIMAYAGICGSDDLASNSVPYFHSVSIDQIRSTMAAASETGVDTATDNAVPTVSVVGGTSFVIPPRTPFVLTANGTDADGPSLTYSWEQRDLGAASALSTEPKGVGPLFGFAPPSSSRMRYFPSLAAIASGDTNAATGNCAGRVALTCLGEYLPTTARTMTFMVTVRDGSLLGGGMATATASVVVSGTQRFVVTSPDGGETLLSNTDHTVSWDVAGTSGGDVATPTVDILYSTDGGASFPTVLAADVPNDGSQSVRFPATTGSDHRIMVRGRGNIFFDTSDGDITVEDGGSNVPAAPRSVTGVAGDRRITVSWAAPFTDGGSPVTGYRAVASPGGLACTTTGARTCTISGLTAGTAYTVRVRASNALGAGVFSSPSASVTPYRPPSAPRNVTVTARDDRILAAWDRPVSNGGRPITRYVATARPGGRTCSTDGTRSCVIRRLDDSVSYRVTVRARNVAGFGPASDPSRLVRPL